MGERNNCEQLAQQNRIQKLPINLIPKLNDSKFQIDTKDR